MMHSALRWSLACLAAGGLVNGISVDLTSAASIKEASTTIAYDMLLLYNGNTTITYPGYLPLPYYWWEAGAMFMHMVDYYYYTGDPSNNPATIQAMQWQAGTDGQFMPPNQTKDEGNDDQVFWAFAAMSAAELKFPPPDSGYPSWAGMAQAVFNLQASRWDPTSCGGGLRWQINPLNNGYDYKNMASNGGFFQLASRLARYTGNETYTQWAEKAWEWMSTSVLIDMTDPSAYSVYDGADDLTNCVNPNKDQFSYNYGILLGGLAYLYNHTEDEKWMAPINGILGGTIAKFFPANDIMVEAGCEREDNCDTDELTFKSFTMRWMAITTQLVPQLADQIWPYIVASANGAAGQCDGGDDGMTCGFHWDTTVYDNSGPGIGQQMSALAAIQANMITVEDLFAPLTLATGAISESQPNAGSSTQNTNGILTRPITTGDRAGAAAGTILVLSFIIAGTYWLIAVSTP